MSAVRVLRIRSADGGPGPELPARGPELAVICAVALGLGVASDNLFYGKPFGVSWPIFTAGLAFVGLIVAASGPAARTREWMVALAGALVMAALVALRDSPVVRGLGVGLTLGLLLLAWALRRGTELAGDSPLGYPLASGRAAGDVADEVNRLGTEVRGLGSVRPAAWGEIASGAAIALPFLIVFGVLFAFADSIFAKYLLRLVENVSVETIWRLIRVGVIATLIAGALAGTRRPASADHSGRKGWLSLATTPLQAATVLALVNALFFLFIVVQLTYLFGGEENIRREGMTYAEYARRGFGELCAVAIITFLLIRSIERGTRDDDGGHDASFRLLAATLVLQLMVVLASAHRRLELYEAAYGFTLWRLYAHAFIGWLGILTVLLAARIVTRRPGSAYARGAFWMTVAFIAALAAVDPDRMVARHNLARFDETGKLDWAYLMELSADATPELVGAADRLPADDREAAMRDLAARYAAWRAAPEFSKWQSANLGRRRALAALASRFGASTPDR